MASCAKGVAAGSRSSWHGPSSTSSSPELSGYIQPLSGEYAGRRVHLETIPFFTGYAVEIGHLIDLCEILGLDGLGQVDLDIRIHRNQQLEGLSKMSFTILQAIMKRLEERQRVRLFAEVGATLKLPRTSVGQLTLEVIDLADAERPPMIRLPEYLASHRSPRPDPRAGDST
jgi:glucosyl-3-phosphoglycerate synthase